MRLWIFEIAIVIVTITNFVPNNTFAEEPQVTKVSPESAGLGDRITVTVSNWPEDKINKKLNLNNWFIQLDGVTIPKLPPIAINVDGQNKTAELIFELERTKDNAKQWNAVINGFNLEKFTLPVSVGLTPEDAFPSIKPLDEEQKFNLVVVRSFSFTLGTVFMALLILLLFVLGRTTKIVRSPEGVYSLGRSQMAWWLVIILGSYLFLGLVNNEWTTMHQSALILLGISAATGLGAKMVGTEKEKQIKNAAANVTAIEAQVTQLNSQISTASNPAVIGLATTRLPQLQQQLNAAHLAQEKANTPKMSKNWFIDIISDGSGVSIHRFQNVVWTLALGFVFVLTVVTEFKMPEFNAVILTLMGISSGSYVALKYPER